jgi:hypothetical protein
MSRGGRYRNFMAEVTLREAVTVVLADHQHLVAEQQRIKQVYAAGGAVQAGPFPEEGPDAQAGGWATAEDAIDDLDGPHTQIPGVPGGVLGALREWVESNEAAAQEWLDTAESAIRST